MYHYNETLQDTKGNVLTGYYVGVVTPDDTDPTAGTEAIIYADDAGTAIIADSGLDNRARVDQNGMISFWIPPGEYHLDVYAQDGVTKLNRYFNIPMLSGQSGTAATVTVGTVTTLSAGSSATVTNSGDSQNAILNFGVPQGAAGSGTSFAWGAATGTLSNQTDLQNALNLKANIASPSFTGTVLAPTPANGDNSTKIATTAYVLANAAGLASPAFTGTPTAPTAAADTNTVQLATTAFVVGQANSTAGTIAMNGSQAAGASVKYARADHVHPTDTSRAPLASPGFTGTPTGPTATAGTNTNQLATTAFVQTAISSVSDPWTVVKLTSDAAGTASSYESTGLTVAGATFLGNQYYEFDGIVSIKAGGTAALVELVWPVGIVGTAFLNNPAASSDHPAGDATASIAISGTSLTSYVPIHIRGHFYTGSLAATGSLDIKYKSSGGSTHTASKGSFLRYRAL